MFVFDIRFYLKILQICSKFLKQRKLFFGNITEMLKNLKIKFQQRGGKLKYSIDKKAILLQFIVTFSNKILLSECILPIYNLFTEQRYLDKSVFCNVNRLKNKIKHFPQLFALCPQIAFHQKPHYFFSQSTITIK